MSLRRCHVNDADAYTSTWRCRRHWTRFEWSANGQACPPRTCRTLMRLLARHCAATWTSSDHLTADGEVDWRARCDVTSGLCCRVTTRFVVDDEEPGSSWWSRRRQNAKRRPRSRVGWRSIRLELASAPATFSLPILQAIDSQRLFSSAILIAKTKNRTIIIGSRFEETKIRIILFLKSKRNQNLKYGKRNEL